MLRLEHTMRIQLGKNKTKQNTLAITVKTNVDRQEWNQGK